MKIGPRQKYSYYKKFIFVLLLIFTAISATFIYHTIFYTYKNFDFAVSEDYIPPAYLPAGTVPHKPAAPTRGTIYLTFDDGPGDDTARLLDVLKKYDVKATFFITNRGDDALITREVTEGHAVGLHTCSHNYSYIYQNINNFFADLDCTKNRVLNATGLSTNLIRFPGGSSNTVSRRYDGGTRIMSKLTREVAARGYSYFDWNVDSDDAGRAKTAEEVYNNVITHLKDGNNIVLQHDIKPYSVDAVEHIILYGLNHNFKFNKLSADSYSAHHGVNN